MVVVVVVVVVVDVVGGAVVVGVTHCPLLQFWPVLQVPQLSVPPQPFGIEPQLTFCAAQVVGVQHVPLLIQVWLDEQQVAALQLEQNAPFLGQQMGLVPPALAGPQL